MILRQVLKEPHPCTIYVLYCTQCHNYNISNLVFFREWSVVPLITLHQSVMILATQCLEYKQRKE